jgi:hypothetical protein
MFKKNKYDEIFGDNILKLKENKMWPPSIDYIAWVELFWNFFKVRDKETEFTATLIILFIHDTEKGWSNHLHCVLFTPSFLPWERK